MTREQFGIGVHHGCGGTVQYGADSSRGVRWCDRCGMNSHAWWTDAGTGIRRPPESPETVEEWDRRNR